MIRDDFIAEARSWIGTPYMKDAGVKGGGTNCSRFVLSTIETVFNVNGQHLRAKPHFVLFREKPQSILDFLGSFCTPVSPGEIQIGDIAVVTLAGIPCQTVIYSGGQNFIYALRGAPVIEGPMPANLEKKITHVFRPNAYEEG